MPDKIEVPLCLSGGITAVNPSLCMDGATHLIHTSIVGSIRVLGSNDEARKALEKYQDKEIMVTVCGYPKRSVNCSHLEAYSVQPSADFAPKLHSLSGMAGSG